MTANASNPCRILAVGAAHVDRCGRARGPYVAAASNPGTVTESIGGAAFNAALVLRALGAEVGLVSSRGGDADGGRVAAALAAASIGDLAITWLDRRTPTYLALLDDGGELVAGIADMALYDLLTGRCLSRRHLRDHLAASDALFLDANLPESGIDHLLGAAGLRPVAAIGVSPAKAPRLGAHLVRLAAVFLSRAEAASLLGTSAATEVGTLAQGLRDRGARRAVVTDGAAAAAILDEGSMRVETPPAVEAVGNVTGAGDTLAAVAALSLFEGRSFVEGVRLGMAAAARRIAVASQGGAPAARQPRPPRQGPTAAAEKETSP